MNAQVLVVDDTADNLTLMTYLLQAAGHHTISATSGAQALTQAASHQPDLIMLDVQLPDMDGYQVLVLLREDPRVANVPVIAVTAYAMVGDRDHALAAGFDAYLAKPIDPYTFAATVDNHLPIALRGRPLTPRAAPDEPTAEVGPAPNLPEPGFTTVLAVDDNRVNLRLLRSMLEPHGYLVLTAGSVQGAIEALSDRRPDIVLSDLHLGSASGVELLASLRADPDLETLPFAFFTASAASGEPVVDDPQVRIIRRPIEPSSLLHELADILGNR